MQLRGAVSEVVPQTEPAGQSALVVHDPAVTQMETPSPQGSTQVNPPVQSAPLAQGPCERQSVFLDGSAPQTEPAAQSSLESQSPPLFGRHSLSPSPSMSMQEKPGPQTSNALHGW